jgi:hypothetical protein
LYSLFKEVFLWARSNIDLLLIALPQQIRDLVPVAQEQQLTSALKQKYPKKEIVGLGSFFVLFCTIGTQVRSNLSPPLSSSLLPSSHRVLGIQRITSREASEPYVPMDSTERWVVSDATEACLGHQIAVEMLIIVEHDPTLL